MYINYLNPDNHTTFHRPCSWNLMQYKMVNIKKNLLPLGILSIVHSKILIRYKSLLSLKTLSMIECYCLKFFTTKIVTLQFTFLNVLCCWPNCWRLWWPFEPARFLIKNKIIQSLIHDQPMLSELLNHCLDY